VYILPFGMAGMSRPAASTKAGAMRCNRYKRRRQTRRCQQCGDLNTEGQRLAIEGRIAHNTTVDPRRPARISPCNDEGTAQTQS
jgi:hypothetical protein